MIEWLAREWPQVVGFATGAACVVLAVRRNVWTFPVGIANNVVFLALFATTGLYAAAGLQIVYLALGVHGWYRWRHGALHDRGYVARTPRRAILPLIAAGLVIAVAVWTVLVAFTDSEVPVADAATTAASLVAQYMLNRKWIGNWPVWIGVDIAFAALSAVLGLWLVAALYVGFIGLCVVGWRAWHRVGRMSAAPLVRAASP